MPYWDKNSGEGVNREIKKIINVFLEYDFKGFDPQTEEFINEPFEFKESFKESKRVVDNLGDSESKAVSIKPRIYLGISVVFFLLLILVWIFMN